MKKGIPSKITRQGFSVAKMAKEAMQSINPDLMESIAAGFRETSVKEVDEILIQADQAFQVYKKTTNEARVIFLRAIAKNVEALRSDIIEQASENLAWKKEKVEIEFSKMLQRLNHFAEGLENKILISSKAKSKTKSVKDSIDTNLEIHPAFLPLGSVLIFTGGRFPNPFAALGGDVIAALASGNGVVLSLEKKDLPTNILLTGAIKMAIQSNELPNHIFTTVHQEHSEVASSLIEHPLTKAVVFSNAVVDGKALLQLAQQKTPMIPIFASMDVIIGMSLSSPRTV